MAIAKITIYRNEAPSSGMRTSIEYNDLFQSCFTWNSYKNEDGVAYIEHTSTGKATVCINEESNAMV